MVYKTSTTQTEVLEGDLATVAQEAAEGMFFVTGNLSKFREVEQIFKGCGLRIERADIDLIETKSTQREVVLDKVAQAFAALKRPVIVDDTCLYIDGFEDFPGVRTKRVMKELGPERFRDLIAPERQARFVTYLAMKGATHLSLHHGTLYGKLVAQPAGVANRDWEYNDFFVPDNEEATLAEIPIERRATFSHRAKAFTALLTYLSGEKS